LPFLALLRWNVAPAADAQRRRFINAGESKAVDRGEAEPATI